MYSQERANDVKTSVFLVSAYCGLTFFVAAFLTGFDADFGCFASARVSLASWAANKALNLLRASSVAFNAYFLFVQNERLTVCDRASTLLHSYFAWSVVKPTGRRCPLYSDLHQQAVNQCIAQRIRRP